jgi:hypothetical protein
MKGNATALLTDLGFSSTTNDALILKYPNLANKDYKLIAEPRAYASPPRLACFDFDNTTTPLQASPTVFQGLDDLRQFLKQAAPAAAHPHGRRRLFVFEGLHPGYLGELGRRLDVDPRVWFRHSRVAIWEQRSTHSAGNAARLPTIVAEEGSHCLDHCQLYKLNAEAQNFELRCAENERHIGSSRQGGNRGKDFDDVAMVLRKTSFWSRKEANDGWIGKNL